MKKTTFFAIFAMIIASTGIILSIYFLQTFGSKLGVILGYIFSLLLLLGSWCYISWYLHTKSIWRSILLTTAIFGSLIGIVTTILTWSFFPMIDENRNYRTHEVFAILFFIGFACLTLFECSLAKIERSKKSEYDDIE